MIFDKHKAVHIHITKTAGSSVRVCLDYPPDPKLGHADIFKHVQHLKRIGENPEDYFKFTFVRNPFDRAVSTYYFLHNHKSKIRFNGSFEAFLRKSKYFKHTKNQLDWIASPVWKWSNEEFRYTEKSKDVNLLVDFVGRFENLKVDMDYVFDRLSVPKKDRDLPHIVKGEHDHYRSYYNDETKRIVEIKSERDLEYFGYEF